MRAWLKRLRGKANRGFCPICQSPTWFVINDPWLRDNYRCVRCDSIPRFRHIIHVLESQFPDWRDKKVHESSPGGPSSAFLRRECKHYSSSHFYEDVPRGNSRNGHRSEDLAAMTFEDDSFDLFVTQDVFEHVIDPARAFSEISRVLRPGGAHVFTMPWYPSLPRTRQRAALKDGEIVHLEDPVYHGNPISGRGSLVTFDWGRDFSTFVFEHSGMTTTIFVTRDRSLGLDGEFLEVFVSQDPAKSLEFTCAEKQ